MFGVARLTDPVVRAAVGGSQPDLARVLEAIGAQVRLMVAARLSPTPAQFHAVEDIIQQAMIALATGISRLDSPTVSGLRAFASGIVRHTVCGFLSRHDDGDSNGPVTASLDSTVANISDVGPLWQFLSASGTSPSDAASRAEQITRVMAELGRLKPEHREVINIAFLGQVSLTETARQMGISRPAASMLLARALNTLRRSLAPPRGSE